MRANDGVSLAVESGTIHGLLGENGAGKTTLMKVLSGYQSHDGGRIVLDGQPVRFASPAEAIARGIGMLHQDPLDFPPLTVMDNFLLGRQRGLLQGRGAARNELRAVCQHFGFDLDPDALTGSLTIGERQQLEIVRLLALGVQVIILDEPTTGISAPQKVLLFETLRRLASEGLSVDLRIAQTGRGRGSLFAGDRAAPGAGGGERVGAAFRRTPGGDDVRAVPQPGNPERGAAGRCGAGARGCIGTHLSP